MEQNIPHEPQRISYSYVTLNGFRMTEYLWEGREDADKNVNSEAVFQRAGRFEWLLMGQQTHY